jgi:hypothetical protein
MVTLSIVWSDLKEIFLQIGVVQLVFPMGILLWLTLLWIPNTNVDRRDVISGITYVLFMVFAAILMLLVLPQRFSPVFSPQVQMLIILLAGTIASFRWFSRREAKQEKIDKLIEKSGVQQ